MKEKTGMLLAVWQTLNETVPVKSETKNPFDDRISSWTLQDFADAGFAYYKIYNGADGGKELLAFYTEEDLDDLGLTKF